MSINGSRNLSTQGFGSGPFDNENDPGPMAGLGNLADAMLVFACGLIVALIAHYGVALNASEPDGMQKLDASVTSASQEEAESVGDYSEVGSVYRDEATGELYIVANEGESLSTNSGEGE